MGTRYIGAETIECWYVATISTPTAPTTTELNAGTDLTGFIVDNGLQIPETGRTVDASDGSSRRDKTVPGTYGGDEASIEFHRQSPAAQDTAWATLPRNTAGYLAIAPYGLATPGTWAIADVVDIIPIQVVSRTAINQMGRTVTFRGRAVLAITDDTTEGYALAA